METRLPKRLWIQLYVTMFVCLAIWLNPSRDTHEEQLRATLDPEHPVLSAFLEGDSMAPKLEYRSYVLFSVTRVAGERTRVGFLGRVFTGGEGQ